MYINFTIQPPPPPPLPQLQMKSPRASRDVQQKKVDETRAHFTQGAHPRMRGQEHKATSPFPPAKAKDSANRVKEQIRNLDLGQVKGHIAHQAASFCYGENDHHVDNLDSRKPRRVQSAIMDDSGYISRDCLEYQCQHQRQVELVTCG